VRSLHPLSEEKVLRGLSINIVTEKKPEKRETIDRTNGALNLNTKAQSVKLYAQSRMLSMVL
jgi:hypothetical protein